MDRLLIASRYLLARPISLVATLVFIVAVVALVLVDSIMNGFLREHREMLRRTSPDVAISLDKDVRLGDHPERILAAVRACEGVETAGLRRSWPAMYRLEDGSSDLSGPNGTDYFVQLRGMDLDGGQSELAELQAMVRAPLRPLVSRAFESRKKFQWDGRGGLFSKGRPLLLRPPRPEDPLWYDPEDEFWRKHISDSEFLDYPLEPILFGEQLAVAKSLWVGSVVKVIAIGDPNDAGNYPKKARYFVVVGSYRSDDSVVEDVHVIMRRAAVLDFCGTKEKAEEIAISVSDPSQDQVVRDRLAQLLGAEGFDLGVDDADIETWEQRKKVLLNAVHNERSIMNLVLLVVVGIAGFALLVTLSMMVNTKIREVGVLIAMGASAWRIVSLFLLCGMIVSLVGITIGLGLGLWLCANINELLQRLGVQLFDTEYYSFAELPTEVDPERLVKLMLATLLCGVLASLVPSLRAGRLEAVEALRQG